MKYIHRAASYRVSGTPQANKPVASGLYRFWITSLSARQTRPKAETLRHATPGVDSAPAL